MDWYSASEREELAGRFGRFVDVSLFGGDLQCAVDRLTTVAPDAPEKDQSGGLVYIPAGCTAVVKHPPLVIASGHGRRRDNIRILGAGSTSRIAADPDSWPGTVEEERALVEIRGYPSGAGVASAQDWIVENLHLDGAGLPGAVGLRLHRANFVGRLRNLWVTDCPGAGVVVQHNSVANVFDGLVVEDCGEGIRMPRYLPWEEYRRDLILYRRTEAGGEERRFLCNRHDIPASPPRRDWGLTGFGPLHVGCPEDRVRLLASSACCGGCPPPAAKGCCPRAWDAPELGCWQRPDAYACEELVYGRTEEELERFMGPDGWHVRHAADAASRKDLREQPGGIGPGNSVTFLNCEVRGSTRNGMRLDGPTNVRLVNSSIVGSVGHGLTLHYTTALQVEGCVFEDNGADTPAAQAGDVFGRAQVIVGDSHRHDPDPPRTDGESPARGSVACTGVQFVGSQFRRNPGRAGGDVGVYVAFGTATSLMGCLFDGHGRAAVGLVHDAVRTALLSNTYRGGPGVEDAGSYTEDYDRALA